jgi:hypothetical protein
MSRSATRLVTPKNIIKNPGFVTYATSFAGYLGDLYYENGHIILYSEEIGFDLGDVNDLKGTQQALAALVAKKLLAK